VKGINFEAPNKK